MRTKDKTPKSMKYALRNYNGIEIFFKMEGLKGIRQKYFLEYNYNGRKKYYGRGSVKTRALEYIELQKKNRGVSYAKICADLAVVFKEDIAILISELDILIAERTSFSISLTTNLLKVLEEFYSYKEQQHLEGTVDKVSMYGYKHHQLKLMSYFKLNQFSKLTLADLNSNLWQSYRIDLLNNTYGINKKKLKNSSVNQHFQYVTQFYTWLIDYNEMPMRNHLRKLKRLSEATHDKRFKVIPDKLFNEFYKILETKEKVRFTRLYLASLFLYENNIRLSEQVLIQMRDMNLDNNSIRILNRKNDSVRTVIISSKAKELIKIILHNTIEKGIDITDEKYLFGGYNRLKSGMPLTHKELGIVMREFRLKYPQFKFMTLYEQKHTSITNQFNSGVEHYEIKERANHSSISTTEIYLQSNRVVQPYVLKSNEVEG